MVDHQANKVEKARFLDVMAIVAIFTYGGSLFLTFESGVYGGSFSPLEAAWETFFLSAQGLPLMLAYSAVVQLPLSRLMMRSNVNTIVYMIAQCAIGIYVFVPALLIDLFVFRNDFGIGGYWFYFLIVGFLALTPTGAFIRWVKPRRVWRISLYIAAILTILVSLLYVVQTSSYF
ncbi:hypothetical protein [Zhihengliuella halotolerans]|uniref:Uncharacterized protein n=1 Tax=Zhihengliuella halotolerans TaxID=370736 RepID=A0A4Q8AGF3_9MICC|nr:hypothetical protein [Zhihengliuella halotolerans]RZU63450.1 hypothetical protein EV380_3071 [Zhihengliuella halotolerans]